MGKYVKLPNGNFRVLDIEDTGDLIDAVLTRI